MAKKKCSVDGCSGESWARGLCNTHYRRLRIHGSPTGGGAPRGKYVGSRQSYYQSVVLSYDGEECLIWPYRRHAENGYALWSKTGNGTRLVSRMVCEDVFGPPPFPDAEGAHSCGNGHLGCVAKKHLRWDTPAGNQADKLAHGTDNRGTKHPLSKLSDTEVREIRRLGSSRTQISLANQFGVTEGAVRSILIGKNWAWLK